MERIMARRLRICSWGGRVKGGLYGKPPSLTDLQDGDLKYTIDYRSLYATVIQKWWRLPSVAFSKGDIRPSIVWVDRLSCDRWEKERGKTQTGIDFTEVSSYATPVGKENEA